MQKMSQGKSCGIFIRSSTSGPVEGQNTLSKRVFDGQVVNRIKNTRLQLFSLELFLNCFQRFPSHDNFFLVFPTFINMIESSSAITSFLTAGCYCIQQLLEGRLDYSVTQLTGMRLLFLQQTSLSQDFNEDHVEKGFFLLGAFFFKVKLLNFPLKQKSFDVECVLFKCP